MIYLYVKIAGKSRLFLWVVNGDQKTYNGKRGRFQENQNHSIVKNQLFGFFTVYIVILWVSFPILVIA